MLKFIERADGSPRSTLHLVVLYLARHDACFATHAFVEVKNKSVSHFTLSIATRVS